MADLAAAAEELDDVADGDVPSVMSDLTTLICQADALRVAVTALVRRRELYRQRGAGSVAGWLRQDPRLADQAGHLSRLANQAAHLPKVSAALAAGQASLSQAGTASWQISQLPDLPERPADAEPAAMLSDPDGEHTDPDEALWAGLWRTGDVHAAADELFAQFLPELDADQLRVMGAHLREAADAQDRARDDYNSYAKRALRITRLLGDTATISGHLHPEAAEQIMSAFEELGAKAGPDDTRTKPQRWADALAYLASLITPTPAPAPTDLSDGGSGTETGGNEASTGDSQSEAADREATLSQGQSWQPAPAPESAVSASHWLTEPDDEPSPEGGHGHTHTDARGHPSAQPHLPGAQPHFPDAQPHPPDAQPHAPGAQPYAPGAQPYAPGAQPYPPGAQPHPPGTRSWSGAAPRGLRRPRVIVTVPLTTLLGRPLAPGAVLGNGTPLTAEAARRLACDADIVRLLTDGPRPPGTPVTPPAHEASAPRVTAQSVPAQSVSGQSVSGQSVSGQSAMAPHATAQLASLLAGALAELPRPLGGPSAALDIGRQSQSWTPRQRDALYALYGGRCAKPGCTRPIDVIHHIIHWLHGGKTQIANGAPLCLYDHWLVHEGGWQITRGPDGTLAFAPPPPTWRPGTVFRHGKPLPDTTPPPV